MLDWTDMLPVHDVKNLSMEQLLQLAAEALRRCHEELKKTDLEVREFLTIEHPLRQALLDIAARLDEVAAQQTK
jgi:hypothetical protein